MYATAAQAIDKGLRHKGTGEILPTKTVARNTKLVYLHDDLVGLRFHNTFIAYYERDHVRIDTRDRHHPEGWFTVTTWNRIDEFTPARTFTRNGLRHIMLDPAAGWDGAGLFAHGALVSPNGSCEVPDLTPEQSDAIIATKANTGGKIQRWVKNVVGAWREWAEPLNCCTRQMSTSGNGREMQEHYFSHFREREVAVHPSIEMLVGNDRRLLGAQPDALAHELERKLSKELLTQFLPLAIAHIAPNFPYPQIARSR